MESGHYCFGLRILPPYLSFSCLWIFFFLRPSVVNPATFDTFVLRKLQANTSANSRGGKKWARALSSVAGKNSPSPAAGKNARARFHRVQELACHFYITYLPALSWRQKKRCPVCVGSLFRATFKPQATALIIRSWLVYWSLHQSFWALILRRSLNY